MTKKFIDNYIKETEEIIHSVNREDIEKFIDILFETWKKGKKVISLGNGGSASTASHFTADLLKTVANTSSDKEVIESKKGLKAICLNDNVASLTAWTNDSGWGEAYKGLLNTLLEEGDTLLLVSVHGGSGWSGNIVQAMDLAKTRNARIVGLSGFDGGKMKELADVCIVVPADSTPHVEGLHGVLQHLIIWRLKEMIDAESSSSTIERLNKIKEQINDTSVKGLIERVIEEYQKTDQN